MPKWLKCDIAKGMFSDEFTVTVRARNGELFSFFVPKFAVEEESGRVKVQVEYLEGQQFAWLPDEHRSVVDIEASDLQPA